MKNFILNLTAAATIGAACVACSSNNTNMNDNPFFAEYDTPYQIPPFEKIRYEHYMPAVDSGIVAHNNEIQAIIDNPETPNFENTVLAYDNSGSILRKVQYVIYALGESDNTPEMEKITTEATPKFSAHADEILMNLDLFEKFKKVHNAQDSLGLNTAQRRLLDKIYRSFVRNGALLSPAGQDSLKKINAELSSATLSFGNNILKSTNATTVVVENEAELAGIPQATIDNAAKDGKWVFTVHAPVRLAVLSYADNRDLRRKMYEAYTSLCSRDDEFNNSKNINTILRLREQKAKLLGFESFAAYQMDNVMSKTVKAAEDLLYQIWNPAIEKVKEEVADMQAYVKNHGGDFKIEPWDYYYYAEKVKAEKFDLDENEVRPYFALDNVVEKGLFNLAKKLYGVTFTEMPDAPKYNPEVKVYDVKDAEGNHVAVFMTDYFVRETKRQGAWMSEFGGECNYEGKNVRPIIFNVGNYAKPTKDSPALLSLDDVATTFHEFGHALQGMLTTAPYFGISGTNVDRDFVELCSQIDEHWAMEPELLKEYAIHYKTGEVIPDALLAKLNAASKFNQGFITTELVGAALLDIEWHKAHFTGDVDVVEFEKQVAEKLHKPAEVQFRYRSPYFNHIFGSDQYAAGYYTYLWAEVLDADGYELFSEKGPFNKEVAESFLNNILRPGDSEDPMTLYLRFRGKQLTPDALLRNRGLK